jgi:hypothetical protein
MYRRVADDRVLPWCPRLGGHESWPLLTSRRLPCPALRGKFEVGDGEHQLLSAPELPVSFQWSAVRRGYFVRDELLSFPSEGIAGEDFTVSGSDLRQPGNS